MKKEELLKEISRFEAAMKNELIPDETKEKFKIKIEQLKAELEKFND